jgi:uncharacterized protein
VPPPEAGPSPAEVNFLSGGERLADYRTFGASTGEPRQLIDWRRHREDYHAAIAFARGLPGVDADRIVLWGSAYSGAT